MEQLNQTFYQVYDDILTKGRTVSPRGASILELENYSFKLPPFVRFVGLNNRKLNLDYVKEEFLWYLRANPRDDLITEAAQVWKDIKQPDGTYLSNYGIYWFANRGFHWVVNELTKDKDSRRAVIPMLAQSHLYEKNPDVVCTYSVSFRIRRRQLNMTVNMRSQDAVWGMTNDIPCFSFLHEMVHRVLRETVYEDLDMGEYTHNVDSLHVYERHFDMLRKIVDAGPEDCTEVECPTIDSANEVFFMLERPNEPAMDGMNFLSWLQDNRYRRARGEP